jgi:hypothetical protein
MTAGTYGVAVVPFCYRPHCLSTNDATPAEINGAPQKDCHLQSIQPRIAQIIQTVATTVPQSSSPNRQLVFSTNIPLNKQLRGGL